MSFFICSLAREEWDSSVRLALWRLYFATEILREDIVFPAPMTSEKIPMQDVNSVDIHETVK